MSQRQSLGLLPRSLLAVLLAGSAGALYFSSTAAISDVTILQSRWLLNQWQAKPQSGPTAVEWGRARNDLAAAKSWTPGDPQIYEKLGYLYAIRAISSRAIPDLEQAMLAETVSNYRASVTRRPMSPYAWANLALALHLKRGDSALMWQAYDRAMLYGQNESGVLQTIADIGFQHWETAGQQRQSQLRDLAGGALEIHRNILLAAARRSGKGDVLGH